MSSIVLRPSYGRKPLSVVPTIRVGRNTTKSIPLYCNISLSLGAVPNSGPSRLLSTAGGIFPSSFSTPSAIPQGSSSSPSTAPVSASSTVATTASSVAHSSSVLSSSSVVSSSSSSSTSSSSASFASSRRRISDGYIRNQEKLKRKEIIDEMLRVDQAGEVGAVQIYAGQMWVLKGTPVEETLRRMKEGEEKHVETINRLIAERRVRPTALLPVWEMAGFALGVGTALLGKEAAMACTVAVETAISGHYNDQIRTLLDKNHHLHTSSATPTDPTTDPTIGNKTNEHEQDDKELAEIFRLHRDEELEHHDTALKHDAQAAPFYSLLSTVIQVGCSAAIYVAKKI